MHLNSVVFPQPEGPINAVTRFFLNSIFMFFNASLLPNQPFNEVIESLDSLSPEAKDLFSEDKSEEEDSSSCFLLFEDFKILNIENHLLHLLLQSLYYMH